MVRLSDIMIEPIHLASALPAPEAVDTCQSHHALELPEIWLEIVSHLNRPSDLRNAAIVCRTSNFAGIPRLYHKVLLIFDEHQDHMIEAFLSYTNPGLRYLRHLIIAPIFSMNHKPSKDEIELDIDHMTERVLRTLHFEDVRSVTFYASPNEATASDMMKDSNLRKLNRSFLSARWQMKEPYSTYAIDDSFDVSKEEKRTIACAHERWSSNTRLATMEYELEYGIRGQAAV